MFVTKLMSWIEVWILDFGVTELAVFLLKEATGQLQ
jgi:hypothetical protein